MINSLLDTDLYKISMQQAVIQKFPKLRVRYSFIDRNNLKYPKGFSSDLKYEVIKMADLRLTDAEEKYLRKLNFLNPAYIDFLKGYQFDPNEVTYSEDDEGHLKINIEGYWYRTILWEVPLMAILSELYFIKNEKGNGVDVFDYQSADLEKAQILKKHNAYYADFGTRRRYSKWNHERIVRLHIEENPKCFVGTSNMQLAMRHNIKAIGTMAHEWIMVHGALYGYKMANQLALQNWAVVYDGDLGIALSDTYTTKSFLQAFDKKLAKLFDGVRQDSGDPFKFVDQMVAHYQKLGIDPKSKVIVFSDGLNPIKAANIKEYCVGKIKSSFGIGTNFTNDVGVKPLNIVIKINAIEIDGDWYPTVKLSDDSGKHTGNEKEVQLCKKILRI